MRHFTLIFLCFSCAFAKNSNVNHLIRSADSAFKICKYASALMYYQEAEKVAIQYDTISAIQCLLRIGEIYIVRQDANLALHATNKAHTLVTLKDLSQGIQAKIDLQFGSIYHLLDDYNNSISHLHQSLINFKKLEDTLGRAHSCYELGYSYTDAGKFDSALFYLTKASKLQRHHNNKELLAKIYNELGYLCYKSGEDYRTIEYYEKSLRIRKSLFKKDHPKLAESYHNIGIYYFVTGDYEKSLNYSINSAKMKERLFGEGYPNLGTSIMNIGYCYFELKNYEESIRYFKKALVIWDNHFGGQHVFYSLLLRGIAKSYEAKKELKNAEHYYKLALLKQFERVGKSHLHTSYAYLDYGDYFFKLNRHDSAALYFHKAYNIQLDKQGEKTLSLAKTLYKIAKNTLKMGQWDAAMAKFQEALVCGSIDFEPQSIFDNPGLKQAKQHIFSLKVLESKADAFFEKYEATTKMQYLTAAFNSYQLCIEHIHELRLSYSNETKGKFSEESMRIFEKTITTAYHLLKQTNDDKYHKIAFELMEQSKAFMLVQGLKENKAKLVGGVPDSLITKESNLRKAISNYKKDLFEAKVGGDSVKVQKLQQQLFITQRKLEEHIQSLERQFPKYFNLKFTQNDIQINQIQANLDSSSAIYEYFMGDQQAYLFHISSSSYKLFHLGNVAQIRKKTIAFIEQFNSQPITNNDLQTNKFCQIAYYLFKTLFPAPIFAHQIIIPDDVLAGLPFDLLLTEPGNGNNFKQLPYLLHKSIISYAYSLNAMQTKHTHQVPPKECLALAPSYKLKSNQIVSRSTLGKLRNDELVDLPGAQLEVKTISDHFNGDFLFGDQANEDNFKALSPSYRIIHIAAHANADNLHPLNSKMSLAASEKEDGRLYAYEIYNLAIPAELVVLSACQTGSGKLLRGEGVMSLARSFMYAGSSSVVQTYWKTDDEASATIMNDFYAYLAKGYGKNVALTLAKRNYLKESYNRNSHPYYWASFALVGDPKPLNLNPSNNWIYFVFGAIGILVLVTIWFKKYRG